MSSRRFFYFKTSLKKSLTRPGVTIESKITQDPLEYHKLFQSRFKKDGILTCFPEFEPAVSYLESALHHPDTIELANKHSALTHQYNITKNGLFHLKLNFKIEDESYPHTPPMSGPYSYLPTITEIGNTLGFLDSCYRSNHTDTPPLYHTDRYKYHTFRFYHYDKDKNPFILFPTAETLTLLDFIKTRSVPIGFIGVSSGAVFADAYYNSPLDFHIHDYNHVRRYQSANEQYIKKHHLRPDAMYEQFNSFIQKIILPGIALTKDLSHEERTIRQLMCVLYFELLHEYALTPDRDSFIEAFKHKPEAPSPFEHMVDNTFSPDQLETRLRMSNNNLKSGMKYATRTLNKGVTIRYFFDKGPNFLTSAYNKLANGFYDNHFERHQHLPPVEVRTPELVAKAAERILCAIGAENLLTHDQLLTLIKTTGFIEVYHNDKLKKPERIVDTSKDDLARLKTHYSSRKK